MLQVYTDVKRLTVSAFSWPARYIALESENMFDFNSSGASVIPENINIQYVNPVGHLKLLTTIVKSWDELQNKIKGSLACSLHIDGSVDKSQIDKIYILLEIVTSEGKVETIFLGIVQKVTPGAQGLFDAVIEGIIDNVGIELYHLIMMNVTTLCTDGANINIGVKGGLWAIFKNQLEKYRNNLPFIKLWCAAHRSDLAWNSMTDSVKELHKTLSVLSSIASYFRTSSLHSDELKQIAAEHKLTLLSIPKLFEIRWTEWTYTCIKNILRSWNALVIYFKAHNNDSVAAGYFNYLTNYDNLKLMVFVADVLQIFQHYHKNIQSDSLTIVTLKMHITALKKAVNSLEDDTELIGGWENQLKNMIVESNDQLFLKEIELTNNYRTSGNQRRQFQEIRKDIIE